MIEQPFIEIVKKNEELGFYVDFITYCIEKDKLSNNTKQIIKRLIKENKES